jgi:FKBP-type peptidyl-prolyl cis-trans isomerase
MKAIKFFAAALAVAFAVSCGTSAPKVEVDVELPTAADVDSVSYLIGVNFGSFIKGNNFAENLNELDMAQIKKGMEDFLKAEGNPYDPTFGEQFDIDLNKMGEILNGYLTKKTEYKKAVNKKVGEDFLAKNILKENVDSTATGLQYTIEAPGAEEKITKQDTVWVNYKGTRLDGEVFDQNDSVQFDLRYVVPGFAEGICLLGEGGKATLYIPSNLAYGERGNQNIEPNSTLIFEVEILKVNKFVPQPEEEKPAKPVKKGRK